MSKEELLKMLQDKGMDDDAIKVLLRDTMAMVDQDFAEHDEKEGEEEGERKEAENLLGVSL